MFDAQSMLSPPAGLAMSEPFQLRKLYLKNRIIRSSLGGKLGFYDGSPSAAWTNFEKRFARTGVAALISATVSVDESRYSPLQYLKIADDRFIPSMRAAIHRIKAGTDCAYILQLGDPGSHCQTSLLPQRTDARSASWTFDLLYGYPDHAVEMSREQIAACVRSHAAGAKRAKETGCDGIEITLSKGYLAHQFLNPAVNRRRDEYGGSVEGRFRFAREIVTAVREAIGPDFPFGVRLSAADYNYVPLNLRLPITFPLRRWAMGNGLEETTYYAKELEGLGVDWIHLSRGYGFINPKESPGDLPVDELRMVYNTVSHLSRKARLRSLIVDLLPDALIRATMGLGWTKGDELGATGRLAAEFRKAVRVPLIANGGFQSKALIEDTLRSGNVDLVSLARPLLANPDLLDQLRHRDEPEPKCTFCNRCSMLTAIVPVGCYDRSRFPTQDAMEAAVLRWATDPDLGDESVTGDGLGG